METCPCGSGRAYTDCCGPYIAGSAAAPSAEALMRSRYTAYAKGAVDYIVDTCVGGSEGVDREATRRWSEESEWLGLKILRVERGEPADTDGRVEFVASYIQGGLKDEHHELARFVKQEGRWLYDEGEIVPATIVRAGPKVGRNDPCPCGSGKKYKQCCGR